MKPNTIAWLVIGWCVAIALLFAVRAPADVPTLAERVALVAPSVGSRRETIVPPPRLRSSRSSRHAVA